MSFEEISRVKCHINALPGDTFGLYHTENGKRHQVLKHYITEPIKIDVAIVYKFENEFGLKEGLMGIFGSSK